MERTPDGSHMGTIWPNGRNSSELLSVRASTTSKFGAGQYRFTTSGVEARVMLDGRSLPGFTEVMTSDNTETAGFRSQLVEISQGKHTLVSQFHAKPGAQVGLSFLAKPVCK